MQAEPQLSAQKFDPVRAIIFKKTVNPELNRFTDVLIEQYPHKIYRTNDADLSIDRYTAYPIRKTCFRLKLLKWL
jgi:hypothetical protein